MADGSPTVSPMWVELDGDRIVLSTEEGRTKPRNFRNDDRIALSAVDPADIVRAITVRGRIADVPNRGLDDESPTSPARTSAATILGACPAGGGCSSRSDPPRCTPSAATRSPPKGRAIRETSLCRDGSITIQSVARQPRRALLETSEG